MDGLPKLRWYIYSRKRSVIQFRPLDKYIYSGTDRWASRTWAFHHQTTEGAQLLSPGGHNFDSQFANLSMKEANNSDLSFNHILLNIQIFFFAALPGALPEEVSSISAAVSGHERAHHRRSQPSKCFTGIVSLLINVQTWLSSYWRHVTK